MLNSRTALNRTPKTHDFSGPNASLVSVTEALGIVLATALTPEAEDVGITDALGRVLTEAVTASDDLPRFDMVSIDGIAISNCAPLIGSRYLIAATQRAGTDRLILENTGDAIEVMAGCILPGNTECVLAYEQLGLEEQNGQNFAVFTGPMPQPGQYINRRGSDRTKGTKLISAGTEITAAEIAVAASLGRRQLRVAKLPRIAVITTGDELVPLSAKPLPWQMFESNSHAISVILKKVGVDSDRFHLPDDPEVIAASIAEWTITYDILLFSGGSSKGVGDYLPPVLSKAGIIPSFHGVSQRPGKPFWFGQKTDGPHGALTVFALPGNPVSSFVCAYKYCLPWLEKSFGRIPRAQSYALLANTLALDPDFTHFIPVRLVDQPNGTLLAEPLQTHGSGDHAGLLNADAFMELSGEQGNFQAGKTHPILRYR